MLMSSTIAARISAAWSRSSASVICAAGGISVLAKTANSLMIASWCSRMNALRDTLCSADRRANGQRLMEPASNLGRSSPAGAKIARAPAPGSEPEDAPRRSQC